MNPIMTLLAVGAGGAVGALSRHAVAMLFRAHTTWPEWVSTLLVNFVGCFAIGMAFVALEEAQRPVWIKALFVTGLLGAFTTFSTFSLDAMHLIHDGKLKELGFYVVGSVLIGLAAVKLGMLAAGWGGD